MGSWVRAGLASLLLILFGLPFFPPQDGPATETANPEASQEQTSSKSEPVTRIPERLGWYEIPDTKLAAVYPRSTEQDDFRFYCQNVVNL